MKSLMEQKLEEVSLLLAGALIGIAFIPYENRISFCLLSFGILLLVAIGLGLIGGLKNVCLLLIRENSNRKKRVCVYAPVEINSVNSSWVHVTLSQLFNELENKKINYSHQKSESKIFEYPITINPYGGV